ncbi:Iron(III) dicitrate transport ATP-binding protein [Methanosarcina siciliae T4/M]|uniref:Cobalamin import ATP-binding protein BtuD n=2 Tax=Methanosarcina siciliae TaxID=38027 RepID=A0A0E3PFR9_9EURY|nr:ABC transporter ATP-binding protein [Methanosarcina siciliae]AKB29552.1 Iron(III) dicitrate transport ATP-binding protein [Methanosarcina siciliae T4/M]AKB33489.1 Iron(III) dicitrate transport ATP-binding protein [Methanosarcina siciliae HI350]
MILEVDGVEFQYRSKEVLRDIKFHLKMNEILAILGPNGVGKTTLLKCMNAILKPKSGTILIENEDVLKLEQIEIARRLGYVPQHCECSRLTSFDAILLGRIPHIKWEITTEDLLLVEATIKRLHLEELALRYIDELSGGELQKIGIARAIAQNPKLLLLDEPTSSLDLKNQLEILDTIREVVRKDDMSAIMTMHDLNLAFRYADKFLFLKDGTIFAAGGIRDITPEIIKEVYGVPVAIQNYMDIAVVIPAP